MTANGSVPTAESRTIQINFRAKAAEDTDKICTVCRTEAANLFLLEHIARCIKHMYNKSSLLTVVN